MQEGILTASKHPPLIENIINTIVGPRGFKNIRANLEDYEKPARLNRERDEKAFIPDITATINGRKSYFELVQKTEKVRQMVTKWQLLSRLATLKRGKLYLITPNGHYAFANRLLKKYPIEAKVIKL